MRIYFYSLTYQIFCLVIRGVTYQQTFINIYYTYWPNYPHFSLHTSVYNNAVTKEAARPSLIQLLFLHKNDTGKNVSNWGKTQGISSQLERGHPDRVSTTYGNPGKIGDEFKVWEKYWNVVILIKNAEHPPKIQCSKLWVYCMSCHQ